MFIAGNTKQDGRRGARKGIQAGDETVAGGFKNRSVHAGAVLKGIE